MSAFSAVVNEARKPSRTLLVPTSAFCDDWDGKPAEPVCCGLRLISTGDAITARSEAARVAWDTHPLEHDHEGRIDAYNDALMRWVVARGTCDPNNVREGWDIWQRMPEDMVKVALSPDGVRFVFDAIQLLASETSPVVAMATDEQISELSMLADDELSELPAEKQIQVRQLLGAAHEILTGAT